MHHRAGSPLNHLRNEQAIQANGRKQIQVQLGQPMFVCQCDEAAALGGRTAKDMGEDVDAAQAIERRRRQRLSSPHRRQICLHKLDAIDRLNLSARRGDDPGAAGHKAVDGGAAQPLGAATDEHALARELAGIDLARHAVMSTALMAPFSSAKR